MRLERPRGSLGERARRFVRHEPLLEQQCCIAEGKSLPHRHEVDDVAAATAGTEAVPAVLAGGHTELRGVRAPVQRAWAGEPVGAPLEGAREVVAIQHLQDADGRLHLLEVHEDIGRHGMNGAHVEKELLGLWLNKKNHGQPLRAGVASSCVHFTTRDSEEENETPTPAQESGN